jgi:hypothetical protein
VSSLALEKPRAIMSVPGQFPLLVGKIAQVYHR